MEKTGLDNIITVSLSTSRLELGVEESVWRAIGKHYLTVQVSFLDKQSRKILDHSLSVEGNVWILLILKRRAAGGRLPAPNMALP